MEEEILETTEETAEDSNVGSIEEEETSGSDVPSQDVPSDPRLDDMLSTLQEIEYNQEIQRDYSEELDLIHKDLVQINETLMQTTVSENTISQNGLFDTPLNDFSIEQMLLVLIICIMFIFGGLTLFFKGVR